MICGRDKYEFELRGNGFARHIGVEHSAYSYLAYLVYIQRRPLDD
jgi:hypothetical protein